MLKKRGVSALAGFGMAVLLAVGVPALAGQGSPIAGGEVTAGTEVRNGELVPEAGTAPPPARIDQNAVLLRARLQNPVGHPAVEAVYRRYDPEKEPEMDEYRAAFLLPAPVFSGTFVKAVGFRSDPAGEEDADAFAGYLIGDVSGLQYALGADTLADEKGSNAVYSLRAKRRFGAVTLMGGASREEEAFDRYGGGLMARLPAQLLIGGHVVDWDGQPGYAFNLGRYTEIAPRTDPSFSLNYLSLPDRYSWTNFRIIWGRPGINYVPPTFENPVFSGQYDIDLALLLNELVPDNYRHFDSPLLYRRFDEYGRYAFRVNHIEVSNSITRLDANFSYSPDWVFGPFSRPHATLTFDRLEVPVFGRQPDRWWLDVGGYFWRRFYAGVAHATDFEGYEQTRAEIRYSVAF